MPRFVLLRHECPPGSEPTSHWDFMLQQGDVLLTWRLESLPSAWSLAEGPGEGASSLAHMATRLADHRLAYLDYEGPISDGRGDVRRVDRGWYFPLEMSASRVHVQLAGDLITGYLRMEHASGEWRVWTGDQPLE